MALFLKKKTEFGLQGHTKYEYITVYGHEFLHEHIIMSLDWSQHNKINMHFAFSYEHSIHNLNPVGLLLEKKNKFRLMIYLQRHTKFVYITVYGWNFL